MVIFTQCLGNLTHGYFIKIPNLLSLGRPPMQVYLPYKDFRKCVSVLDTDTLKRQRKNAEKLFLMLLWKTGDYVPKKKLLKEFESLQVHPVFLLWYNKGKPFAHSLFKYLESCNFELFNRKFNIEKYHWFKKILIANRFKYHHGTPPTPRRITTGYRIVLTCFNEEYYKEKFFATYRKNQDVIQKLKKSKERFRFSKFLGLGLK